MGRRHRGTMTSRGNDATLSPSSHVSLKGADIIVLACFRTMSALCPEDIYGGGIAAWLWDPGPSDKRVHRPPSPSSFYGHAFREPQLFVLPLSQVSVYQPFFLAAQLPHDLNFATFRPPLFVRLITKSQRWGGKSVVEHYYYWRDTKGLWQEHVVAVTAIMHAYPDADQPSIGWERYCQYMRSYGYSVPTEQKSDTNAQNISQDNTRSGLKTRARAPTLEELWQQGITPSLSQRGRLCQFSVLNSGAGAGPASQPSLSAIQPSLSPPRPQPSLPIARFFLSNSQPMPLPAPQLPLPASQSSASAIQRSLLEPRLSLPSTQPLLPSFQPSLVYTQSTLPASQPSLSATQTLQTLQPFFQQGDRTILELLGLDSTPRPTVNSEVTP